MPRGTDGRKSENVHFRKLERERIQRASRKAQRNVATAHTRGEIPLEQLSLDCGTQSRFQIDPETRQRYSEAMRAGDEFPAIVCFYDGTSYLLADGFHRVAAALDAGIVTLPVDLRQGTLRDAILFSVGANRTHGLPRTRSDIDRAISLLLSDPEWSQWSDREIARRVGGVTHVTVGKKRAAQMSLVTFTSENAGSERTYTNKHGVVATMNTARIGKNGRTNDLPTPPKPQPVVPALPDDLPVELVRMVDERRLSHWTAIQMGDVLRRVPGEVRDLALRLDLDGTERIGILTNLYKRREVEGSNATFDEIVLKGSFHYGDEMDRDIDFVHAPLREVYSALKSVSRFHARLAAEAQQQSRIAAAQTPAPEGRYRCIVIDPPWPMEKFDRDSRPGQGLYPDYATMTLEQIEALDILTLADPDGCHLYLWTTQRFLPDALNLVGCWGFSYRNLMTWVKPTGMPVWGSWQYNTEHVVFASRGSLAMLKQGEQLSFDAPSQGHSIKPNIFYERIAKVSPGPRLDMFARQAREGFTAWGFEAPVPESEVAQ